MKLHEEYFLEQEQKRFNSDGEELYNTGNGLWLPIGYEIVQEYESKLSADVIRPQIQVIKIIAGIITSICTSMTLALLINNHLASISTLNIFIILVLASALFNLKEVVVLAIIFYQRFAPNKIRNRCIFIPTCSSYTILVLEKYGVIVGLIKAISRMTRCRYPNGGEDYP